MWCQASTTTSVLTTIPPTLAEGTLYVLLLLYAPSHPADFLGIILALSTSQPLPTTNPPKPPASANVGEAYMISSFLRRAQIIHRSGSSRSQFSIATINKQYSVNTAR